MERIMLHEIRNGMDRGRRDTIYPDHCKTLIQSADRSAHIENLWLIWELERIERRLTRLIKGDVNHE